MYVHVGVFVGVRGKSGRKLRWSLSILHRGVSLLFQREQSHHVSQLRLQKLFSPVHRNIGFGGVFRLDMASTFPQLSSSWFCNLRSVGSEVCILRFLSDWVFLGTQTISPLADFPVSFRPYTCYLWSLEILFLLSPTRLCKILCLFRRVRGLCVVSLWLLRSIVHSCLLVLLGLWLCSSHWWFLSGHVSVIVVSSRRQFV